jgi:hypothetical protein
LCELIQVNGLTFNSPPTQLGLKEITISHGSSVVLDLSDFTDTAPPYFDPEFDQPELIKVISGFNSDVVLKDNGVVVSSEVIVDANNINLVIEDLENLIPEHFAEYEFRIKSYNSDNYSIPIGRIKVKVLERLNNPPVAILPGDTNLSYDSSVDGQGSISINGCSSYDPDGDDITYSWTINSEPPVIVHNVDQNNPCIYIIRVNDPDGSYNETTFSLTLRVTDSFGAFSEDNITITLNDLNPNS